MNRTLQSMLVSGIAIVGIAAVEFGPTVYNAVNPQVEEKFTYRMVSMKCSGSMVQGDYRCVSVEKTEEGVRLIRKYDLNLFQFDLGLPNSRAPGVRERFVRTGVESYEFHGVGGIER